jgi:hypothetical protein
MVTYCAMQWAGSPESQHCCTIIRSVELAGINAGGAANAASLGANG